MKLGASARLLVRVGAVLLLAALAAAVWELLAWQSPTSPYAVDALPGPVKQLRETLTIFAVGAFVTAWLTPWISRDREPWLLVALLLVGMLIAGVATAVGATTGMYGIQISDPRPDSRVLFWSRAAGWSLVGLALAEAARRLLFGRSMTAPSVRD